jgi:hypothetical protein
MKTVRRIIIGAFYLMGTWTMVSFAGVMFNPGNAEIWTMSLMWSLLASLLVMPGLVLAHHASHSRSRKQNASASEPSEQPSFQPPFVEKEQEEAPLWPAAEEKSAQ